MADVAVTDAGLRQTITERLDAVHVEVTDMSGGCGQAFAALIVSPQFTGLNSLKRHRRVNAALRDEIAAIHAWTAKCRTPDEWERDKAAEPVEGMGA
ncbi:bolA-like protein [Hirsutella rhossiliensis]|uniref:BolA-like protein n=1 Tax=Hirsutella rhossiliensis TaxID=111463 RepID=A0A9P8MRH1_9HYPO|nr:bolA-like protein [Hirsutella rhossiliensis]KAH0959737.1 bolA-like protein [Hirsutella rhossiliensis]